MIGIGGSSDATRSFPALPPRSGSANKPLDEMKLIYKITYPNGN